MDGVGLRTGENLGAVASAWLELSGWGTGNIVELSRRRWREDAAAAARLGMCASFGLC